LSITAGFTAAEIVEFVYEYQRKPHGQKACWLAGQGVTSHQLRRWRAAVFDGDLDRGLIPRDGGVMSSPTERSALAREAEIARRDAELARLQARVRELEQTNEALGKAIGLLHARNEEEPDAAPTTNDPSVSSTSKTHSWPS
jgi:transposase-like protein